ncbi:MAG TPA: 50S ribosomal protein L13 [Anaerolineales bacterium]|nr:50S ribosomal protein L13 [Anaerolineales bacterium]
MQKSYYPKLGEVSQEWYLVDAQGQTLGRLATRIARALIGKNKPQFTPGVDIGDFVVVVNAEKITVSGKRLDQKVYYHNSGYPGGMKAVTLRDQLVRRPERVIRSAVWGMLPHNRYGRRLLRKLRVFAGPDHEHQAQKPTPLPDDPQA